MQRIITACVLVLFSLLFMCSAQAAPGKVEYLEAKPLSKVIMPRLKPVEAGTKLVYVITWGGDVSLERRYRLLLRPQATARPDQAKIAVEAPPGWRFAGLPPGARVDGATAAWSGAFDRERELVFDLARG